jgi:hypothetical protein
MSVRLHTFGLAEAWNAGVAAGLCDRNAPLRPVGQYSNALEHSLASACGWRESCDGRLSVMSGTDARFGVGTTTCGPDATTGSPVHTLTPRQGFGANRSRMLASWLL